MKIIIFVMIINQISTNEPGRCSSSLLKKCFCGPIEYYNKHQYVVNCTNTGFNNTEMLTKLPEETQVLIFTGNHVPVLPWNIFGDKNVLSLLTVVDMSNNGIQEIKGKTFHHVPNVERLILNHNNLKISDDGEESYYHPRVFSNFVNLAELHLTNAFADNTDEALADDLHDIFVNSNLTKLFKLHLEQNEIRSFKDRRVFCDLPDLRDLYLSDNFIPSLNFNVTCLKKLRFLDLEHNNITKFRQQELDSFDRLAVPYRTYNLLVDISGNPLRCDSAIKNLYVWMQKTNVSIRNQNFLQCHQERYGMKYIVDLKFLAETKANKMSNTLLVLLVVLILILFSLISAFAYLSRDTLKSKCNPLLDVVSRKVHYTTIESQDV